MIYFYLKTIECQGEFILLSLCEYPCEYPFEHPINQIQMGDFL